MLSTTLVPMMLVTVPLALISIALGSSGALKLEVKDGGSGDSRIVTTGDGDSDLIRVSNCVQDTPWQQGKNVAAELKSWFDSITNIVSFFRFGRCFPVF